MRFGTEFVYGYYIPPLIDVTARTKPAYYGKAVIIGDGYNVFEVKPDTVRQFVGYDCDGKEIYDGDYLINEEYGIEGRAELQSIISGEFSDRLFDKNGQNKDFRKDDD